MDTKPNRIFKRNDFVMFAGNYIDAGRSDKLPINSINCHRYTTTCQNTQMIIFMRMRYRAMIFWQFHLPGIHTIGKVMHDAKI